MKQTKLSNELIRAFSAIEKRG